MTTDDLRTALQGATSISEVAATKGIEVQTVIDALVTEAQTRLAKRVAAGDLTQAEADARLTEVTTQVTDMVDSAGPVGRHDTDDDADDDGDGAATASPTA